MINFGELNPEALTGHPEIDKQHEALFKEAERLKTLVIQHNKREAVDRFEMFLDQLTNHFTYEEVLMHKIGYPEAAFRKHKLTHRTLQEIYLVAYKPILAGQLPADKILELFESNFLQHLWDEDMLLATFIKKNKLHIQSNLLDILSRPLSSFESPDSEPYE